MHFLRTVRKFVFGLLAVAIISYGLTLFAQQKQKGLTPPPKPIVSNTVNETNSESKTEESRPYNLNGAPFVVGERLVYGVSLIGFPTAGRIEMEVAERGQFFGQESYQIRTKVESLGQVRSLFGEVDNQYTSYAALDTALPYRVITSVRQGQLPVEETVLLDHSKKQAVFSDDHTIRFSKDTYDLTSLAYALRLRPVTEGSKQKFSVLYGKELVDVEAEAAGRERVQTQAGTFNAIVVKLTPKKKFTFSRARIWFSDDDRRLPVMIVASLPLGEARADLASVGVSFRPLPPLARIDPPKEKPNPNSINIKGTPGGNGPGSGSVASDGNGTNGVRQPGESIPKESKDPIDAGKGIEERSYPFLVGERLNYDIAWGNFASVGKASFEVRRLGMIGMKRVFEFYGEATSAGAVRTLVTVNDQLSSFALVDTLTPVRNDIRLREGKRFKQVSATYDWSTGKALLSTGSATEIRPGTLDLVSLFYAVRASELKIGAKFDYLFLDANNRLQTVTIRVAKQETINSPLGARDSLQLDILAPEPIKLLLAQVWISNDSRRIPLYLVTRTRFGELRFQLTSAVNIK